jgi:hypothetical protein
MIFLGDRVSSVNGLAKEIKSICFVFGFDAIFLTCTHSVCAWQLCPDFVAKFLGPITKVD